MQSPRWFDASTRSQRLLALVLLAIAVAVPIAIWRTGAPLPVGKPEEERAFEPALQEVTKTSRSESTTQDLPASRIALQLAASSGTRATSVGREIRVHVLDSTTEATVPSAEIRWIEGPPQPGSGAENAIWRRQVDPEPWFREQGRVVVADADGLATIRSAAKSVWVSVRRDGLYGEARCDPATTREVWVRLEPDIALEVRVSSAGGTPCAGVDGILQASRAKRSSSRVVSTCASLQPSEGCANASSRCVSGKGRHAVTFASSRRTGLPR